MSKKIVPILTNSSLGGAIIDGVGLISSRDISRIFKKRHDNVLQAIDKCEASKNFTDLNFQVSTYKDSTGRKLKEYLLTKDGFAFIAMGFTGKEAAKFKEAYINRFNEMEQFIISRNIARLEYPELTREIKQMYNDPPWYRYSNEADMINKIVLGVKAGGYRKLHDIGKNESIRDYMTVKQIELIQELQKYDSYLVGAGKEYELRKEELQYYFNKKQNRSLLIMSKTTLIQK